MFSTERYVGYDRNVHCVGDLDYGTFVHDGED